MGAPYPILHNGMASGQGIWDTATSPQHDVGTRGSLSDGRVFYYARNSGAALVAGNLVMSEVALVANDNLAVNTASIGDTSVTITSGTATASANDLAGGYLVVVDDTGEGITYKIASHPAITATASIVISLVDPINVAFAAATTVSLVKNPWQDVVIAAAAQAHFAAGIPQCAVGSGATTKQYFWCQTWGISAGWADAATAVGAAVTSGTTPGQIEIQGGTDQQIGVQYLTAIDTENQPVFLTIAP